MKTKSKCYELNCSNVPFKRVGVNMLKLLGIQPGTQEYEKQKHLMAVAICKEHFLERFPAFKDFKKSWLQGILIISKPQYIKMSRELYDISIEKVGKADFRADPRI